MILSYPVPGGGAGPNNFIQHRFAAMQADPAQHQLLLN